MRSRFLKVDYFSSRSSIRTLNRFQFLPLPVPLPSPDPGPSDPSPDLGISLDGICIDQGITLDVDLFPIEDALSQFLSDVIPKTLPAAGDGGSLRMSPMKKTFRSLPGPGVFEDNKVSEGSGAPDVVSEIVALLLHEEKDLNGGLDLRHNELPAKDSEGIELHKEFLFEIVEVDLPLAETIGSEPEVSGIRFEIQTSLYLWNISASFPFKEFGIILEYGGPYASSRLSSMVPKLDSLPRVHFIHVEFATHPTALFLCEGPDICKDTQCTQLTLITYLLMSAAPATIAVFGVSSLLLFSPIVCFSCINLNGINLLYPFPVTNWKIRQTFSVRSL